MPVARGSSKGTRTTRIARVAGVQARLQEQPGGYTRPLARFDHAIPALFRHSPAHLVLSLLSGPRATPLLLKSRG